MVDTDPVARLRRALWANDLLAECLKRFAALSLPDWYLGAGCISQTMWNIAHGQKPTANILDYDLVYYDPDLSEDKESLAESRARELVGDLPIQIDVKNEARVHLWYPLRFGYNISPYKSVEEAIATWPTTATSVGIRLIDRELEVYAPFGLEDLLNQVVRANRVQVTRDIFETKASRWKGTWPRLTVLPWDQGMGIEGERHLGLATKRTESL